MGRTMELCALFFVNFVNFVMVVVNVGHSFDGPFLLVMTVASWLTDIC